MSSWKVAFVCMITASLILSGCGKQEETTPSPSTATTNDAGTNASKEAAPSNNEAAADTETESTESFVAAVNELVDGLKTGAEKGSIDWAKSQELYNSKIKSVVQARDAEAESQINEKLEAAANAGKDGSLEPAVVAQIHDKLLQNIAFLTLRHDFTEASEKFTDKETVSKELKEARTVYDGILKGMVEKRDTAYSTSLISVIDSGFTEMEQASEKGG